MAFLALAGLMTMGACTDEVPTFDDDRWIPVDAETVELRIPFDDFVEDFQVFEGFGSAAGIQRPFVAREYREGFDSHALLRFERPPAAVSVFPSDGENVVTDSQYVAVGGTLVVRMDTLALPSSEPVELTAGALQTAWHPESANWLHAVDTLGNRESWSEAGGGPARTVDTAAWDPTEGDSLTFQVDSATAGEWIDQELLSRGARVSTLTPGALLQIREATFRPMLRPSVNADTVVTPSLQLTHRTFIYEPQPGVSQEEIRVGGAPARRAFLTLRIPAQWEGTAEVCARVSCPIDVTPQRVLFSGLVLHTAAGPHPAFQPFDTIRVDLRPALAADRIPRSPLGSSVQPIPRVLTADAFEAGGGSRVEVPMTRYVRDLLRADEDEEGEAVPNTLAILAAPEPGPFPFATFAGPGQEGEPFLRIILTLSEGVQLP